MKDRGGEREEGGKDRGRMKDRGEGRDMVLLQETNLLVRPHYNPIKST